MYKMPYQIGEKEEPAYSNLKKKKKQTNYAQKLTYSYMKKNISMQ